jgi:hypothetical protein
VNEDADRVALVTDAELIGGSGSRMSKPGSVVLVLFPLVARLRDEYLWFKFTAK